MSFGMGSKYDGPRELEHGDLKTLVDFNVQMAFFEYDLDKDGFLNFDEWRRYASEDTDVKEFLASWKTAMVVIKCPWAGLEDVDGSTNGHISSSGAAGGGGVGEKGMRDAPGGTATGDAEDKAL